MVLITAGAAGQVGTGSANTTAIIANQGDTKLLCSWFSRAYNGGGLTIGFASGQALIEMYQIR
jgi:hypothetical protein